MNPKFTTAAPFIAAFVILRNKEGHVAFVLRKNTSWMDGFFGLPAGKVEWNETFSQAAVREAKEEVGVTIRPESVTHAITVHRHSEDTDWVDSYFVADSWEGEVINAEPEVHAELAWFDLKQLPENIVPPQRAALEAIEKGLKYSEYGWDQS